MPYGFLGLIVALVLAGLFLWVISQIPMDATIARIIRVVVIVVVCIYVLYWLIAIIPGGVFLPPPRR